MAAEPVLNECVDCRPEWKPGGVRRRARIEEERAVLAEQQVEERRFEIARDALPEQDRVGRGHVHLDRRCRAASDGTRVPAYQRTSRSRSVTALLSQSRLRRIPWRPARRRFHLRARLSRPPPDPQQSGSTRQARGRRRLGERTPVSEGSQASPAPSHTGPPRSGKQRSRSNTLQRSAAVRTYYYSTPCVP